MTTSTRDRVATQVAVAGFGCAGLLALWGVANASISGTDRLVPVIQDVLGVVAITLGYLLGRATHRWLAAVAAILVVVYALWYWLTGAYVYPNADAALAVQMAALIGVAFASRAWPAMVAIPAIAMTVGVTVLESSWAGFAVGAVVVLASLIPRPRRSRAVVIASLAGLVTLVLAWAALAFLLLRDLRPAPLVAALSDNRFELWSDAVALIGTSPWTGHGPGSFAELSPTAADPDLRPAHNALLEVWAEQGVVGLALLLLVVLGGYAAVAASPSPSSFVAVAAWTGFWLHAMVDYIADFPLILAAAGLVLGAASRPLLQPAVRTAPRLPD